MKTTLSLLNFLFVLKCPVCREPLEIGFEGDGVMCPVCRAKWEIEKGKLCPECGQRAGDCRCTPEIIRKAGASELIKLCFYEADSGSAADRLVLYIKDYRDKRVIRFVAKELCALLNDYFNRNGIDIDKTVFTYLPRSYRAVESKGFDQAKELAVQCARDLSAFCDKTIRRKRFSKQQKGLNTAERKKNAARAFFPEKNCNLEGVTAVLFDDVVTTGAGLSVGTVMLKKMGAEKVLCISVARTESNPQYIKTEKRTDAYIG